MPLRVECLAVCSLTSTLRQCRTLRLQPCWDAEVVGHTSLKPMDTTWDPNTFFFFSGHNGVSLSVERCLVLSQ